jgi:hypothetical protein
MDDEYFTYEKIYMRFKKGIGWMNYGGWGDQLWQHLEIVELFMALDAVIVRPKHGDR